MAQSSHCLPLGVIWLWGTKSDSKLLERKQDNSWNPRASSITQAPEEARSLSHIAASFSGSLLLSALLLPLLSLYWLVLSAPFPYGPVMAIIALLHIFFQFKNLKELSLKLFVAHLLGHLHLKREDSMGCYQLSRGNGRGWGGHARFYKKRISRKVTQGTLTSILSWRSPPTHISHLIMSVFFLDFLCSTWPWTCFSFLELLFQLPHKYVILIILLLLW